ncbi:uncharacterized protein CLAFUR5_09298 [Fulvia fulva]|uniref:Aminoglycoside phosphotransferase domain-containing protein n=1 Tax=Passalora fulva TaxID=5499 RepID=A0A9Q8PFM6_PASFU|nr:uncharacterized protein CLAFUR5_09298 [Fulvia fulva]UJO21547.1 hypothetical protein CLAFUR5_09298 [Fulvia fulva]
MYALCSSEQRTHSSTERVFHIFPILIINVTPASNIMASIGSESWIGPGNYEEGGRFHTIVEELVKSVNWDALLVIASRLRDGTSCKLSGKYSCGHFNVVRKLEFSDGVDWIARVRLPLLEGMSEEREALGAEKSMEVEIATMKYLKKRTSIPVPEVYSHSLSAESEVGAPFMLMSYIHGSTAAELRDAKGCEWPLMGTSEQTERFWQRMAEIQVELASCHFSSIGSLHREGEAFSIGPEVITGKGPWSTPDEYYQDVATHAVESAKTSPSASELQQRDSFNLPRLFPELMKLQSKPNQKHFHLVNRDFGIHNVLVNDNFEIVGVIDLDGVIAAPIEMVAQFPVLSGLHRPSPGFEKWEKRPAALSWMTEAASTLGRYVERILHAAHRQAPAVGEVAGWMMSNAAYIVQGLEAYQQHNADINDRWMGVFEGLLEEAVLQENHANVK